MAEIFAREGEEGFRRRETEARARGGRGPERTMVATGGGAACREENLALMLASGRVVALDGVGRRGGAPDGRRSGRPLLDGSADPLAAAADAAGRAAAVLRARAPAGRHRGPDARGGGARSSSPGSTGALGAAPGRAGSA